MWLVGSDAEVSVGTTGERNIALFGVFTLPYYRNTLIIPINCFVIIECYSGWLTLFIGILVNLCPQLPLLRFIFS